MSEIDVQEYLSGKPHATLIGRMVAFVVPPPVRFLASWVAPLTCLVALNAKAVVSALASLVLMVQVSYRHQQGVPCPAHASATPVPSLCPIRHACASTVSA